MLSYSLIFLTAVAFACAQISIGTINVLIVADTGKLFSRFKHKLPSQDYLNPTPRYSSSANKDVFMVTTKDRAIAGQATANLTLKAKVGEPIRFTGLSESANMDAAILIYNISKYSGDEVINKPKFSFMLKNTIQLYRDKNTFPKVNLSERHFWPIETSVFRKGTGVYKIQFGMYHRRKEAEGQKLFGYYEFLVTLCAKI